MLCSLSSRGLSRSCVAATLDSTPRKRRSGIDQILIELAAVGADLFDLALERSFGLGRLALLVARRFELLIALLERVELFRFAVLRRRMGCSCAVATASMSGNANASPAKSAARGSRPPNPPRSNHRRSSYARRFERQDHCRRRRIDADCDQIGVQYVSKISSPGGKGARLRIVVAR